MQTTEPLRALSQKVTLRRLLLEVIEGPDQGQRTAAAAVERTTVGTDPGNDLVLRDASVSRHHMEIVSRPDGHTLRDLESTNGTRVNGLRVREATLEGPCLLQLGRTRLRFDVLAEEDPVELARTSRFGALLGSSAAMRRLFAVMGKVAGRDSTVLVTGESGTGKELVARALHDQSPRQGGPFVVVDCGAMPAGLMEAEILGHEKGAFTGADHARPGAFERADGGTLMLDEIGELPLELQPKLLRVLEGREVTRLGASRTRKVDVRVVAATNRDLRTEVNRQAFRSDLFYRLSVVEIRMPPLRDRTEDIPLLVRAFLEQLAERHGDGEGYELAPEATAHLLRHRWPGNVRELRNFVERSVSLADGRVLGADPRDWLESVGLAVAPGAPPAAAGLTAPAPGGFEALERLPFATARRLCNEAFERSYVGALLRRNDGVAARAAREAQMDRSHLNELCRKHGLK